ncbi:hypothetical protein ACQ4PT_020150 [Festuca glaucescens]
MTNPAGGRGRGRPPAPAVPSAPPPPPPAPSGTLVAASVPAAPTYVAGAQPSNQNQRQQFQGQQRPHQFGTQGNYRQQGNRYQNQQKFNGNRQYHQNTSTNNNNQGIMSTAGPSTVVASASASVFQPVIATPSPTPSLPEQELDPRYSKLICFNCGDPGHFVGNCVRPKLCFICNLHGHPVYHCPEWSKEHPSAVYFGSANTGLGFYHIDVPDKDETQWLNFRNCGVVTVRKGDISLSDLEKNLSAVFCKTRKWPWQVRELDSKNFLVRFPPWKSVAELIEFPAFDLVEGVTVKITSWNMEVSAVSEMPKYGLMSKGFPQNARTVVIIPECANLADALHLHAQSISHGFDIPVPAVSAPIRTVISGMDNMDDAIHFSDHVSWQGDRSNDLADDIVSVDSFLSIPDRWNYEKIDDNVWDFDPRNINDADRVEEETSNMLESMSASLAYCSGVLQDLDDTELINSSDDEEGSEDMDVLKPEVCAQLASVKRNLLPVLNQATVDVHKKKQQWGPVVVARRSSRNHGNMSVLEKAKEYKKKKNLEVPTRFKA